MSGKRHHYIPQFMQRGFLANIEGKKDHTYYYTRGIEPKLTSIKYIGVQEYFYSAETESDLDDRITKLENKQANILNAIRDSHSLSCDTKKLCRLIVFFSIRTKALVDMWLDSGKFTFEHMLTELMKEENINKIFDRAFSKTLKEFLYSRRILDANNYKRWMQSKADFREPAKRFLYSEIIKHGDQFKRYFTQKLKEKYKYHYVRSMSEIIKAMNTDFLEKLNWRVDNVEDHALVLGDAGPIVLTGKNFYEPLFMRPESIRAVLMPVSHNLMIIGEVGGKHNFPVDTVNFEVARISSNFFISSCNSAINNKYVQNIGKYFHEDFVVCLESMISDLIKERLSKKL